MIILMIAMSIAGNLQPQYVSLDWYRPYQNYFACAPNNQTGFNIVLGLVIGFCGVLISIGLFVAWSIRKIPDEIYNESRVRSDE